MLKNKIAPKATASLLAALMATSTAVVIGSPMASAAPEKDDKPEASIAAGGVESPAHGIVWGYDANHQGSYKIPTVDAGELDGFCIDRGRSYPKQPGQGATYGPPEAWGGHLGDDLRKRLIVALMIGQGITTGQIPPQVQQFMGLLGLPPNTTLDDIAAGVSGVVHMAGTKDGRGRPVSPNDYTGNARAVFDRIWTSPEIGAIPTNILDGALQVKIRNPIEGNLEAQRMIALGDLQINFPTFEFPSIPPWTPPTTPSSDENTPPPSSTPSTPSTSETSTTPGTSPRETPSTTPRTSAPRTTPRTTPEAPAPEEPTPEIRTSAGTRADNIVQPGATIVDTVTYSGLEPGKEYRLVGETVDKTTGQKDGNSGEVTFTPEEPNGRIDVPIQIQNVTGSELVVFEKLFNGDEDEPVAVHEDVNDESQTIGVPAEIPEIRTSVDSSTGNVIQSGTVVNDTVSYRGLVPGKSYRLEARLICKADGTDTGATGTHEFVPEQSNGQVTVPNIAVTNPDCNEQVAFEKLYEVDTGALVAVHEDVNDAAQTFGGPVPAAKKKKKEAPAPKPAPEPQPNLVAEANADANAEGAPAPAPGGIGGGAPAPAPVGTGGAPAPRQVINSVPSGDAVSVGIDLFAR